MDAPGGGVGHSLPWQRLARGWPLRKAVVWVKTGWEGLGDEWGVGGE